MDDNDKQSRESQTQILEVKKDIEHLKYILKELEKDKEFLKEHLWIDTDSLEIIDLIQS